MGDLRAAFLDESTDGLKAVRRLERTAQHRVHAESMQRQRLLEAFLQAASCGLVLPWCTNTGKSLIPLTLLFFAQKRNLLIPLELSRVMHQGTVFPLNRADNEKTLNA